MVAWAICLALLFGLLPIAGNPAPLMPAPALAALAQEALSARPAAPNACPASATGLPDVVERANFCVYYNDSNITDAQADDVADFTQAYWDRYVTALGFQTPLFTGKLVVEVRDAASCNGATGPGLDYMYVNDECFSSNEQMRKVVGHELFHRVQYSYHGTEVKWFKEGTARAIEDNAFADIDNWPTALTSTSSFNTEANNYLSNTNADITSIPMRYMSALWWKYFMEQFGTDPDEPELGVDALAAPLGGRRGPGRRRCAQPGLLHPGHGHQLRSGLPQICGRQLDQGSGQSTRLRVQLCGRGPGGQSGHLRPDLPHQPGHDLQRLAGHKQQPVRQPLRRALFLGHARRDLPGRQRHVPHRQRTGLLPCGHPEGHEPRFLQEHVVGH